MREKEGLLLFKALGEETKHEILKSLLDGELCACIIPKMIGKTQSNCSMHLAKLQEWDLISSRREGKKIVYSLKDERIQKLFKTLDMPKTDSLKHKWCSFERKRRGVA